jgi:glycosyltransferase involved in cell wall biosynthesis
MKVVIALPNLGGGGAETHLLTLAEEMRERGVEVRVALLRPEGALFERVRRSFPVIPLLSPRLVALLRRLEAVPGVKRLVSGHLARLAVYVAGGAARRLQQAFERESPDVLLTCLWPTDVVAGLAMSRVLGSRRPKWVVNAAFDLAARTGHGLIGRVIAAALRRAYRRADAFIAPSSRVAHQVRTIIVGRATTPVWTIPNAVQVDRLPALAAHTDDPAPDPRPPTIVGVGRLVTEKGFDVLLQAFRDVRTSRPRTRLLVIGEGPARDELIGLAARLGVADAVTWTGFLQNPFPHMARARVLVASSRWETFGNAVAEAMALGVPVVATRCGGPEDLIEHGVNGLLVPVDDPPALAQGILAVLSDDHTRDRMGAEARRQAVRYAGATVAARYLEGFNALLATA